MQNSAQGPMPKTWAQAWQRFFGYIGQMILGVLVAIALVLLAPILLIAIFKLGSKKSNNCCNLL